MSVLSSNPKRPLARGEVTAMKEQLHEVRTEQVGDDIETGAHAVGRVAHRVAEKV